MLLKVIVRAASGHSVLQLYGQRTLLIRRVVQNVQLNQPYTLTTCYTCTKP
jgi:hypothetical protein